MSSNSVNFNASSSFSPATNSQGTQENSQKGQRINSSSSNSQTPISGAANTALRANKGAASSETTKQIGIDRISEDPFQAVMQMLSINDLLTFLSSRKAYNAIDDADLGYILLNWE